MSNDDLIEKYKKVLEYCEMNSTVPFYSENLLPADKNEIRRAIEVEGDLGNESAQKLDKFIGSEVASQLNEDGLQVELKRQGLKHDEAAAKRYWKTIHKLYGVDERLDQ